MLSALIEPFKKLFQFFPARARIFKWSPLQSVVQSQWSYIADIPGRYVASSPQGGKRLGGPKDYDIRTMAVHMDFRGNCHDFLKSLFGNIHLGEIFPCSDDFLGQSMLAFLHAFKKAVRIVIEPGAAL
jgi:hypothetical protein